MRKDIRDSLAVLHLDEKGAGVDAIIKTTQIDEVYRLALFGLYGCDLAST